MKNDNYINSIIANLKSDVEKLLDIKPTRLRTMISSEKLQIKKSLGKLNTAIVYLETYPSPEFIESQLQKLKRQLQNREQGFDAWLNSELRSGSAFSLRSKYNTEMNIPHLKKQIEMLEFILSTCKSEIR